MKPFVYRDSGRLEAEYEYCQKIGRGSVLLETIGCITLCVRNEVFIFIIAFHCCVLFTKCKVSTIARDGGESSGLLKARRSRVRMERGLLLQTASNV